MGSLDWAIVGAYILGVLGLGYSIGRRQRDQRDYYLAGNRLRSGQVGLSLMANQVSAISLVGAPAFIALKSGGGLVWLQYELAIPLAMIVIIAVLLPAYWRRRGLTIYEYLEGRFGRTTRSLLGLVFLVSRSLGSGVALLAASYVTSVCLGVSLAWTVLLVGVVSLLYTSVGGIKADVYTDIIQLVILWSGSLVCIVLLFRLTGPLSFPAVETGRLAVFDFASNGVTDGRTFSFWPMLFGGLFLYISYYGCDQSQAQRLLATPDEKSAARALALNGILRFLLVLTYCLVGLLAIPLLAKFPLFAQSLHGQPPDYLIPFFLVEFVPRGLLGFMVAGVLAASMSSLDSAINSLSAVTWRDFLARIFPRLENMPDRKKVLFSRALTLFWGALGVAFALLMAGGSETVIELVNKIGSAFYGPIAGVFVLGILNKRAGQRAAVAGLFAGLGLNLALWLFRSAQVSWMWWNLTGFLTTMAVGSVGGWAREGGGKVASALRKHGRPAAALAAWFLVILTVCLVLHLAL
ncbi:MAG: hypothetical protein A2Y86_05935 [Candidatus Aminicenantes bacterium RBG_13_62_12]|nr:MAG: hypothetical protein A2Y86_05935 [Candidatus Aminicenantes bacterium RBG_13_62_12]